MADADHGDDGEPPDPRGPEPNATPVVPGRPSPEHALFVLLGAIAMVLVLLRAAAIALG